MSCNSGGKKPWCDLDELILASSMCIWLSSRLIKPERPRIAPSSQISRNAKDEANPNSYLLCYNDHMYQWHLVRSPHPATYQNRSSLKSLILTMRARLQPHLLTQIPLNSALPARILLMALPAAAWVPMHKLMRLVPFIGPTAGSPPLSAAKAGVCKTWNTKCTCYPSRQLHLVRVSPRKTTMAHSLWSPDCGRYIGVKPRNTLPAASLCIGRLIVPTTIRNRVRLADEIACLPSWNSWRWRGDIFDDWTKRRSGKRGKWRGAEKFWTIKNLSSSKFALRTRW